jgi:uroporphyrin-III C-methyltransferase
MNKEIQPENAEKSQVADKPQTTGKSKSLRNGIIFLLFAVVAAASIAAWQWYEASNKIKGLQQKFENQLVEVDSSIEKRLAKVDSSEELRNISDEVRKKREETDARFKLLEADLTESISKQKILEGLYQDLAPSRNEAAMEEVEQLLLIANQQLRLANNVESAVVAMQEADVRLQRINHPQMAHLQSILAKDMDLLKAVPKVDIVGIGLSLDSLAETIDQLPLAMEETLPPKTDDAPHKPQISGGMLGVLQNFLLEIWTDIKKLIRIEHVGKQDIPPPSHSYFLRENLKLRLLAAHNALLARDAINFKAYLKTSIEWINKNFNNKSKLGISMLETLNQLHTNEIAIALPNISTSYDAVRKYRLATKKETVDLSINSKIAEQKQAEDEKNERLLAEKVEADKAKEEAETKAKEEAEARAKEEAETKAKEEAEARAKEEAETKAKEEVGGNKGKEAKLEEEVGGEAVMEEETGEYVDIEARTVEEVGGENR